MKAPQIVYLVIVALSLGMAIEQHGKPKEGNHNTWTVLISTLIVLGILYWGGFFN